MHLTLSRKQLILAQEIYNTFKTHEQSLKNNYRLKTARSKEIILGAILTFIFPIYYENSLVGIGFLECFML